MRSIAMQRGERPSMGLSVAPCRHFIPTIVARAPGHARPVNQNRTLGRAATRSFGESAFPHRASSPNSHPSLRRSSNYRGTTRALSRDGRRRRLPQLRAARRDAPSPSLIHQLAAARRASTAKGETAPAAGASGGTLLPVWRPGARVDGGSAGQRPDEGDEVLDVLRAQSELRHLG
jgi:hypothetical protein